jgi:hypothetical protein
MGPRVRGDDVWRRARPQRIASDSIVKTDGVGWAKRKRATILICNDMVGTAQCAFATLRILVIPRESGVSSTPRPFR